MPKYAKICQNMLKYAKICQNMPKYAKICQNMPKYAKICQNLPKSAESTECGFLKSIWILNFWNPYDKFQLSIPNFGNAILAIAFFLPKICKAVESKCFLSYMRSWTISLEKCPTQNAMKKKNASKFSFSL